MSPLRFMALKQLCFELESGKSNRKVADRIRELDHGKGSPIDVCWNLC
jgi:hypothetical protein